MAGLGHALPGLVSAGAVGHQAGTLHGDGLGEALGLKRVIGEESSHFHGAPAVGVERAAQGGLVRHQGVVLE